MNVFVQLWKSLYSPKDIARFRFQGIGKTIGYVFLLTFLSVLPMTYYLTTSFIDGIRNTNALLENDLPPFTIENGQLHSTANKPIHIDQHGFTIIFDSTGQVAPGDVERFNNAIGLLKHEAVFVANHQVQYYNYSAFPDMKITNKDVRSFIATIQSLLPVFIPLLFLMIYLFASASKLIGICILAFFGLILRGVLEKKLQYRHTWIMSAYSVTLSTIFFTIMEALQTAVPYPPFIHWFVSIVVLFLAIKEVPSANPQNE